MPLRLASLVGAAEELKSKIYMRVFVVLLRLYSQLGLERTKPTPAGRKTARMAISKSANRGVPTLTGQVPSAPSVLKAIL
jgi:hypothetical protein